VVNNPAYTYYWKLNGGDVGSDTSVYIVKQTGTYNLSVQNSSGCNIMSTNSIAITVKSLPASSPVSLSGANSFCEGDSVILSLTPTTGYSYRWENAFGPMAGETGTSYKAKLSGTYRIVIINQDLCEIKSNPVSVEVKPNPVPPVIQTENYSLDQCAEEKQIVLKVSQTAPDYTYQWEEKNSDLPGATQSSYSGSIISSEYRVRVTLNGCTKRSEPQTIRLTSGPFKPTLFAEGPTVWFLACSDTTATQYKWFYNGQEISGATKYIYIANQKLGTYKVSIAKNSNCFTSSDPLTIPTGTTGIDFMDPFTDMRIYPNPTTGLISVEMNNQVLGQLNITIYAEQGWKIMSIRYDKSSQYFLTDINLSRQPKGTYFIKLEIDKYVTTRKLVVY
jgi:hypothetical protein